MWHTFHLPQRFIRLELVLLSLSVVSNPTIGSAPVTTSLSYAHAVSLLGEDDSSQLGSDRGRVPTPGASIHS